MDDAPLDGSTQLGMFGTPSTLLNAHLVAAHTHQLADGSEAFVAEHLRWNRRRGQRADKPTGTEAPLSQASLAQWRNHSPEFWELLARTIPDWVERKGMLERWEQEHRAV